MRSKVYSVGTVNNVFNRNKITMIDDDGIEWHRYDRLSLEYYIVEWRVIGLVQYHVTGELVEFADQVVDGEIWYHLRCIDTGADERYYSTDCDDIYMTRAAALVELKERQDAEA